MTLTENLQRSLPIKAAAADPDYVLDLRKVCKQFGTDPAVNALIDVDLVLRRMAVDNRSVRLGEIDAVERLGLPRPANPRKVPFRWN
jgi:hypothetical protein